jgi:hypothetical protein
MRRLNITVEGEISDIVALRMVLAVIAEGRVSHSTGGLGDGPADGYCYATTFQGGGFVYATRTRAGNDSFRVWKESQ